MSTPPNDRIAQVEFDLNQFKLETNKSYGEVAKRLRMAEVTSETLIKQVGSLKAEMEYRFDRIDIRLDAQDAHLMYLHEKSDKTDKRLDQVEKQLNDHTKQLSDHTTRFDQIEKQLSDHTTRFDRIDTVLSQILDRLPEKR